MNRQGIAAAEAFMLRRTSQELNVKLVELAQDKSPHPSSESIHPYPDLVEVTSPEDWSRWSCALATGTLPSAMNVRVGGGVVVLAQHSSILSHQAISQPGSDPKNAGPRFVGTHDPCAVIVDEVLTVE